MSDDKYNNFAALKVSEREGVDYRVHVNEIASPVAIVAPHGGLIEPYTSEIAAAIAGDTFSLYCFEGIRRDRANRELHITSSRFDESKCVGLVERCCFVIAIHGRNQKITIHGRKVDDEESVCLGGRDHKLRDNISAALKDAGFQAITEGHPFPGTHQHNICNRGTSRAGAQLELPMKLRKKLHKDGGLLNLLRDAVRSAADRRLAGTSALNAVFAAIILVLSFAAPVAAGPFEDAVAANNRGDYATSLRLLRPLADQGDARAQLTLGFLYARGRGIPQDNVAAETWIRRAANQGYAGAQYSLGVMYAEGQGVPKNYAEALKWYHLAADQGLAIAQNNLGLMYGKGEGVPRNDTEAVKWYRKAADQGHAGAQNNVGTMYENGRGVPRNGAEAVKWYRLAADQGHALAQHNLGVVYAEGRGVPKSDTEAAKWYRVAADQGHADAQVNLGVMYAKGQGVPQDYVRAHMWFNIAAAQGDQDAIKNRDRAAGLMTPAQIAEAQKLAREWKPIKQPPR